VTAASGRCDRRGRPVLGTGPRLAVEVTVPRTEAERPGDNVRPLLGIGPLADSETEHAEKRGRAVLGTGPRLAVEVTVPRTDGR
jgi:hypothetical protein